METSKDKRRFNRVDKNFSVRLAKKISQEVIPEISTYTGQAKNLSACGLYVNIEQNVEIGDTLKVLFLKPNTFYFFDGIGKVVRKSTKEDNSFDIGIDFIDVPKSENRMMDYYIHL